MQQRYVVTCGFEEASVTVPSRSLLHYHNGSKGPTFQHQVLLTKLKGALKRIQNIPQDDVITQYHDVTVYKADFDNLSSTMWLNDNNISFIYEYLERTYMSGAARPDGPDGPESVPPIMLLRPSMAYLLMNSPDAAALKGVIPPLERAKYVFLPINDNPDVNQVEGGAHWSLLVLDVAQKRALYYDTLQNTNYEYAHKTTRSIARYLSETLQLTVEEAPQQANGSDCGILVCEMTAVLVRRLLEPSADSTALKLKGLRFVPAAGRSFMEWLILDSYQSSR